MIEVLFIPGGASLLLLGIKAGAQILNAGLGAVSAYQDFQDARMELLRSNADVILSDAQIDLLQSQGKDAAVLQFFLVFISVIGTAADIADSARMLKLYNKADNIGAAARLRLNKMKDNGAELFQTLDENQLRMIGKLSDEEFDELRKLPIDKIPQKIKHKEIQLKVCYKDGWDEKSVLKAIKKAKAEGKRLLPSEYLEESYIARHLDEFKKDGVAYLVPKKNLDKYGRDILGWPDGSQFVMKKSELDQILIKANGDISYVEECLGIPKNAWRNQEIVKIEITDIEVINLRMSSGFELGANDLWEVGGYLPTGYKEAVCDNILLGNYKEVEIWK